MPIVIRFLTIIAGGVISITNPIFQGGMGIALSAFFIILGLVSLVWGGEMLINGSSNVARKFRIPPIVIGLTILAFGTSAPELFVNLIASAKGEAALLISNVVGSNLSNILLIGGVAAVIASLPIQKNTLRKEIPLSLGATALLFILINDKLFQGSTADIITLLDGVILLGVFGGFLWYVYRLVQNHTATDEEQQELGPRMNMKQSLFFIALGIYGLYVGGELIVEYASLLAEMFGVSKVMIGASIVAIGTSVPELVTSVIAARQRQTDMAIGNIIGSNIFNIVRIIGLCAVVRPVPVETSLNIDILILIGVTFVLRCILWRNKSQSLNRTHGIIMICLYACYLGFLLWRG